MTTAQQPTAPVGPVVMTPANGVAQERPAGDSNYYLATGSVRIQGHRFKWGDQLPAEEGRKLYERGSAVEGAENLRNRDGSRKPIPALRTKRATSTVPHGINDAVDEPDDADEVEVSSSEGVKREGATGDTTPLTDSQSGNRTSGSDTTKAARSTGRGK